MAACFHGVHHRREAREAVLRGKATHRQGDHSGDLARAYRRHGGGGVAGEHLRREAHMWQDVHERQLLRPVLRAGAQGC